MWSGGACVWSSHTSKFKFSISAGETEFFETVLWFSFICLLIFSLFARKPRKFISLIRRKFQILSLLFTLQIIFSRNCIFICHLKKFGYHIMQLCEKARKLRTFWHLTCKFYTKAINFWALFDCILTIL